MHLNQAEKRIEWQDRIHAWKTSGFGVAEWCREQDLAVHQMYYWIKKFKQDEFTSGLSETQWVTVNLKEKAQLTEMGEPVFIHFDSISIEVREGTSMNLVSDIVQVLQDQC
jgi:hypothetical protein